jgi:hypothetical protein
MALADTREGRALLRRHAAFRDDVARLGAAMKEGAAMRLLDVKGGSVIDVPWWPFTVTVTVIWPPSAEGVTWANGEVRLVRRAGRRTESCRLPAVVAAMTAVQTGAGIGASAGREG